MELLKSVALAFALVTTIIAPVLAHSLEEVDQDLRDKDKYFQPVDSEAPSFSLQDADGRVVSLAGLRGKVVVLNFIYTNCPDVCPLHAERIAELQVMINQTPMKAMVEFVTITTDPKRDTGEVLRDYGKAHGLDPVNWVFLTATPDQPEDSTPGHARRRRHADARHRLPCHRPGWAAAGSLSWLEARTGQSGDLRQCARQSRAKAAWAPATGPMGEAQRAVLMASNACERIELAGK